MVEKIKNNVEDLSSQCIETTFAERILCREAANARIYNRLLLFDE